MNYLRISKNFNKSSLLAVCHQLLSISKIKIIYEFCVNYLLLLLYLEIDRKE